MKASSSIQRTLALGLGVSLIAVTLALGVVAMLLAERTLREFARDGLAENAVSVLAAFERGPGGLTFNESLILPAYQMPLSGRYFTVQAEEQTLHSRSLWDEELPVPEQPDLMISVPDGPLGQELLILRTDFRRLGSDIVIVVAADLGPQLREFRRIGLVLAGLSVLALLLMLLLQRYWMRRALLPLVEAEAHLQELQRGKRDLLQTDGPRELQPLLDEINRLLQYSRDSMTRSRRALGNLGHALKSPLGVLLVLAERVTPDIKQQMQVQLRQMQRRIGRELAHARTAGEAFSGVRFAPADDLPDLLDTLQRAHRSKLDITCTAPPGLLPFDQDDMMELLGNIIDNACKWAKSRIAIELKIDGNDLLISVEDDGPGIAAELRDTALHHGIRLDENIEGHGLGLGIVSDMVAVYHGSIDLGMSALGGLLVEIRLPLAHNYAG